MSLTKSTGHIFYSVLPIYYETSAMNVLLFARDKKTAIKLYESWNDGIKCTTKFLKASGLEVRKINLPL